ncbi:MAG: hypothetical protein H6739_13310 [Alphaproteobacteria bacterium]|nr:hypothetical protein [Alphaproteobacteria bacterium]
MIASRLESLAFGALERVGAWAGWGFKPAEGPAPPADSPWGAFPALGPGTHVPVPTGRAFHQHLWFAAGDPDAGDALGRWLVEDVPGRGPAWQHPSDAGLRLAAWWLGAARLGEALDPDLRRRMAGSVGWHVRFTRAHLALRSAEMDHRLVAQAAGLVVAGLGWPGLPDARATWAEGLTLLGRALPLQVFGDGAPRRGGPAQLRLAWRLGRLAQATCAANRVAFPARAAAALLRAQSFLQALQPLPPIGVSAPRFPLELPPDAAPAKGWRLRTWREGGWAIGVAQAKGGASRVVVPTTSAPAPWGHADAGQVLWSAGDVPVLVDPGHAVDQPTLADAEAHSGLPGPVALTSARVDSRTLTVDLDTALRSRRVQAGYTRLVVTERAHVDGDWRVCWPMAPGWAFTEVEDGWEAERGEARLVMRAEGPLRWALEPRAVVVDAATQQTSALVGRGRVAAGERVVVRFEVR